MRRREMIETYSVGAQPKPPDGCRPRWIMNEDRIRELNGAISRRVDWGWCMKANGLTKEDLALIVGWTEELGRLAKDNLSRLEKRDDT